VTKSEGHERREFSWTASAAFLWVSCLHFPNTRKDGVKRSSLELRAWKAELVGVSQSRQEQAQARLAEHHCPFAA
jgi:hypothetical protein